MYAIRSYYALGSGGRIGIQPKLVEAPSNSGRAAGRRKIFAIVGPGVVNSDFDHVAILSRPGGNATEIRPA